MKSLKDFIFKLKLPHKIMLGIILMAVTLILVYRARVSPLVMEYQELKKHSEIIKSAIDAKEKRLEEMRSVGAAGLKITDEQKTLLEGQGNKVLGEEEIIDFIDTVRELAREMGAKDITVKEEQPGGALVRTSDTGGYFRLKRLPLKVQFRGNYETVSSFLFELRGLRQLINIGEVKMYSKDYTANLTAEIAVSMYYSEI
ncbi:MAG: hypothetical protein AB1546_09135 [bacterium]